MIKIYNTQTRHKEELKPVEAGKIRMYVCGPTVYNYIHIGNARTFISFDTVRRYLIWRGYDVTFVQNITDVDDKIIKKANEENTTAAAIAEEYTQAFIEDMRSAGVMDPDVRPKATEEIPEMIELVERLIETDHAYEVEGDVYFSVRSFSTYGKLSGRNIDEMETGHRELRAQGQGLEDRKRDPLDFAVWKAAKPGEPAWESPWGKGRPGWHIECSAMSHKYLGLPFDIHGGGADLVFPHHENEIAQSEAAYDQGFANLWMHGGMLQINSEKMSKSLGNFLVLRDVLKTTRPEVLRMLMLQAHYRSPLDFSQERLQEAEASLGRIAQTLKNISWLIETAEEGEGVLDKEKLNALSKSLREGFTEAMDDDFNTAGALGVIFAFVSDLNAALADTTVQKGDVEVLKHLATELVELMGVMGISLVDESEAESKYPVEVIELAHEIAAYDGDDTISAVEALLQARSDARAEKNWALADAVRDGLKELGLVIEDTPQGQRIA